MPVVAAAEVVDAGEAASAVAGSVVEAVASVVAADFVGAPRFVAASVVALIAGSDSAVVLASAVVLVTEQLATHISDMAMVTPAMATAATAIHTTATVTRITRITGGREWAAVTGERITDRRQSTLKFGNLAARPIAA